MKHRYSIPLFVLALLISLSLTPAAAQDLPRAELTLVVDWSAVDDPDALHESAVDALRAQLEGEEFTPTELSWLDDSRLRVVMPAEDIYDVEDVLYLLEDPLVVVDPEADPAVQIEFVDFSQYAPGQVPDGTCILTTARVAQTEATLTASDQRPALEEYTCPATADYPEPERVQLQPDGTPFATVMTGSGLSNIVAEPNAFAFDNWGIRFALEEDNPDVEAFVDYTTQHLGRPLAIVLDGRVLSAPMINSPLTDGGQITGSFTAFEARLLAAQLQGGAVPISLAIERIEIIFFE